MTPNRFYLLAAGDRAGETAEGPYSKAEANIRATADPSLKIATEAQLEARRARPRPDRRGYTWSDVVGNYLSAPEVMILAAESGQDLADWLKTQALDLWGPADCADLDFDHLAADLRHDAGEALGESLVFLGQTNPEPGGVFINVWDCRATVARYDRAEVYATTWSPAANADTLAELARAAVEAQGGAVNLSGHYYCPPALAALAVWGAGVKN